MGSIQILTIIAGFHLPHHHSLRGRPRACARDGAYDFLLWAVRGGSEDGEYEHSTSSCGLFAEGARMRRTKKDPPQQSETPSATRTNVGA